MCRSFYVLLVVELSSRRVHFAGASPDPDTPWMMQIGWSLTDPLDGVLGGNRSLIMDRGLLPAHTAGRVGFRAGTAIDWIV